MPQVFRIGGYLVFFWANEGVPLEPVHVHITNGTPGSNDTKIWITKSGKCLMANNNTQIPTRMLSDLIAVIEARSNDVVNKWLDFHGEISYYC